MKKEMTVRSVDCDRENNAVLERADGNSLWASLLLTTQEWK